ncbi:winged helix-turn-helix domain-containing protein [Desulfocicer niacini]
MTDNNCDRWSVRLKVWLEIDGRPVIGEGRVAMLSAIDDNGSIIEAARALGMSYRKIRGAIADMEASVGKSLVKTHRGGGHGGGACLTPHAHSLVEDYIRVCREFRDAASVQGKSANIKNLSPNGRFCHSVVMGG